MSDAALEDRRGAKPQTSRWNVQKVAAEAEKTLPVLCFCALTCTLSGRGCRWEQNVGQNSTTPPLPLSIFKE